MRLTIEISDDKIKTAAKRAGMKKADFMKTEKEKIEDLISCYYDGSYRLISAAELSELEETLYLNSNPKTRKEIEEGLKTPLSECEEVNW
ncbi:MAG TPA: hypothetical protein PLE16_06965 [Spirochaetota bacterium]|nr:hypothetical protein [Spirochaetota bacterium]HPA64155.1 hypothetical protein [Spirochaetota bacterium]HPJ15623.1 hypothetical protein [Spirochaetota bacterium]HPM34322.1 hypothetical protein [Spirochaetota bacterium]HQO23156.1 hypothetical protein [Spirochaetota bacterium]